MKGFTAKFNELRAIEKISSEKDAVAIIAKAQQLVSLGLKLADTRTINPITGQALRAVANDMR